MGADRYVCLKEGAGAVQQIVRAQNDPIWIPNWERIHFNCVAKLTQHYEKMIPYGSHGPRSVNDLEMVQNKCERVMKNKGNLTADRPPPYQHYMKRLSKQQ